MSQIAISEINEISDREAGLLPETACKTYIYLFFPDKPSMLAIAKLIAELIERFVKNEIIVFKTMNLRSLVSETTFIRPSSHILNVFSGFVLTG
jgi:hypothetical protein